MNKVLYRLAYQNIKKYKKHFIMMCVLILVMTLFYDSFMIVQKSTFDVNRKYNVQQYGHWYIQGIIENPVAFDNIAYQYVQEEERFLYGYLYDQGETNDGLSVGFVDEDFCDLCANQIIQGQLPRQAEQIAISQTVFEEAGYTLHQKITLELPMSDLSEFEIVGVVHNSQEGYFPDIYTGIDNQYQKIKIFSDRPLLVENGIEGYSGTSLQMDENNKDSLNRYGYNHLPITAQYQRQQFNLAILLEAGFIIIFVLVALTSISLKKRIHELALLRGIGMTSRQLIIMNFYEYLFCTFLAAGLGAICSIGVSYMIMRIIEIQKSIFIWKFDIFDLFINTSIVFIFVLMALLLPIYHSSKQALSGTFEGQQFQYIQVRYRQLRYQNKWRLAWRELKVNKKIFIFLVIILSWHCSLLLMNEVIVAHNECPDLGNNEKHIQFDNGYLSIIVNSQKELQMIEDFAFDKTITVQETSQISAQYQSMEGYLSTVVTASLDSFKMLDVLGNLPAHEDEVLISEGMFFSKIMGEDSTEMHDLHLGDELIIEGKKVKIVGVIKSLDVKNINEHDWQLNAFSNYRSVYVLPSLYHQLNILEEIKTVNIFYDSLKHRDEIKEQVYKKSVLLYEQMSDAGEIIVYKVYGNGSEEIYFNTYILILSFSACTLLCYVFNKYEIENSRNDYSLYQLIGMSRKDILKKQLCKGCYVFLMIELINVFMVCVECLYLHYWYFPVKPFIILSCIVLIICFIVYGLPLRFVLTNQPLDGLHQTE